MRHSQYYVVHMLNTCLSRNTFFELKIKGLRIRFAIQISRHFLQCKLRLPEIFALSERPVDSREARDFREVKNSQNKKFSLRKRKQIARIPKA